jgi:uncharacterized protein with HEPN domain
MLSLHNFLKHIKDEIDFVLKNTKSIDESAFLADETLTRAVIRSLEIIGEATKKIPDDYKAEHPEIEWRRIAGTRDVLIHNYFGVDWEIVWDIVQNKLPILGEQIEGLLEEE